MKKRISKKGVREKIKNFFEQKELDSKNTKKIKRLAMKYKIRLGKYRRRFCGECYSDLKHGKIRVTKTHKIIECECGKLNKWKIN